jgi:polysaccharide pyruvyl transferase WcaK-like protein
MGRRHAESAVNAPRPVIGKPIAGMSYSARLDRGTRRDVRRGRSSVKLVVLNACYSDVQAEVLLAHIDCVIGMGGSILDDAARNFAIGFYGGLGERESVAAAFKQGRAAISLVG